MLREGEECASLAYETARTLIRVVNALNTAYRYHHPRKLLTLDSYPYYSHLTKLTQVPISFGLN